jgi:hypothetical protein
METREYKVYAWDELPSEAQEKALEYYRNWNVEDGFWYEHIPDSITEDIKPHGLEYISFSFSGFYHQGQGASVEYRVDDTFTFARHLLDAWGDEDRGYYFKLLDRIQHWSPDALRCDGRTKQRHGYSNYTIYYPIEFDAGYTYKPTSKITHLEKLVAHLNKLSTEYHLDLEHETFKSLEKEDEHQTSDATLSEYFADADYMFKEDGRID